MLQPDSRQALAFFKALFPAGGLVHFRAVPEPVDGRTPTNHHYQLDDKFPQTIADFLAYCATDGRAAFFLPAIANAGKTHKDAVASLPAVLADFDKGDPTASLAAAEALIGPATITVESGGMTATNLVKLHAYWVLEEPASGAAIVTVCQAREELAKRFGGDPSFKQEAQIIRIPGSVHLKGAPKLVQLRSVADHHYSLRAISTALGHSPQAKPVDSFFDFNNVAAASQVDRALTAPVHAEGADGITRFEAAGSALGHFVRMIRDGKMTDDEAWQATREWNAATLRPPWDEIRLRNDFERLRRIDLETHGAITPTAPALSVAPSTMCVCAWRADNEIDAPIPPRKWLVDGVIPLGTPGLFAAVGDAGKSMMALQLGLYVTTYPEPQNEALGFNDAPKFLGAPVLARGAAVILTSEDDKDEVRRRLASLDPGKARREKPLYVVPMVSAGGARSVLVKGPNGPAPTEFWYGLRAQLIAIPDLKLVVLDPLSSFVGADTNDNAIGTALMTMLAELAATTGAAVMVVHHFAKGRTPANLNEARDAIRGAGAFVDNGRWAIALWELEEKTASAVLKTLGQPKRAQQVGIAYRGGLVKGNAPGVKIARTLVRNQSIGILEDVTDELALATPRNAEVEDQLYTVLCDMKRKDTRFKFAISASSIARDLLTDLEKHGLELSKERAEKLIKELVKRDLVIRTADTGRTPYYEPVFS